MKKLLPLLMLFASCVPAKFIQCPGPVTAIPGDTVTEWMHISMRDVGFVVARKALSVRRDGYCIIHLQCDGRPFPTQYKVGWCEGKEAFFNRLASQQKQ